MKISLITVCYNASATIERCMKSVFAQTFENVEFIIIDGKSTDDTVKIIQSFQHLVHQFITEPDGGIYDGMNKGISLATGDIIGMLNADDFFTDNEVLQQVSKVFEEGTLDAIYGDLDLVNASGGIFRKWRSGNYKQNSMNSGWMPPHPTFYCRRELFSRYGGYRLDLGTSGDYELMLRFIHHNKITLGYLPKVMVTMAVGGASNRNRLMALRNDFKAMKLNDIAFPLMTVLMKRLRKISQFF